MVGQRRWCRTPPAGCDPPRRSPGVGRLGPAVRLLRVGLRILSSPTASRDKAVPRVTTVLRSISVDGGGQGREVRELERSHSSKITTVPPTDSRHLVLEAARWVRVHPRTVTRWARPGKLAWLRTLGGHRRYRESEVRSLLAGAGVSS